MMEVLPRQTILQALEAFLAGEPVVNERLHVGEFGDTRVLFSYQKPIAVQRGDVLVITMQRYSLTTNRHVQALRNACAQHGRNYLETPIENDFIVNVTTGRGDPFRFSFRKGGLNACG